MYPVIKSIITILATGYIILFRVFIFFQSGYGCCYENKPGYVIAAVVNPKNCIKKLQKNYLLSFLDKDNYLYLDKSLKMIIYLYLDNEKVRLSLSLSR